MTGGFTVIEMMVTVFLLALLTAVSGLAVRSLMAGPEQELVRALAEARERALRSGRPAVWSGDSVAVRFLPNGSSSGGRVARGASTWIVDPLTGAVHAAW